MITRRRLRMERNPALRTQKQHIQIILVNRLMLLLLLLLITATTTDIRELAVEIKHALMGDMQVVGWLTGHSVACCLLVQCLLLTLEDVIDTAWCVLRSQRVVHWVACDQSWRQCQEFYRSKH